MLIALALAPMSGVVVVDRMAVIVGKRVVKMSDVERDLRVTAFLNREPLALDGAARKKAAERLIDQEIIRQSVATGGYKRAKDDDAAALLAQIRKERFAGNEARLKSDLVQYGLSEDDLRTQLLWQLTVLSFIQQRFRPGVQIDDQEIRTYYDQHLAELKKQYPQNSQFETLAPKIRASLEGERINKALESWLTQARARNRIDYREEAFR